MCIHCRFSRRDQCWVIGKSQIVVGAEIEDVPTTLDLDMRALA